MKKLLKQLVVPALASRPVTTLANRLIGYGIPIFMLHRMIHDNGTGYGHTPAYLRQCLEYLVRNGHSFISLEDIIAFLGGEAELPPKPIAFTMDDGFSDQGTLAAPVFIEFNCPATIFVVSGLLDGDLWPWFCQVEYLVKHARIDSLHLDLANGRHTYRLTSTQARSRAAWSIQELLKTMPPASVSDTLDKLSSATGTALPAAPPQEYQPISWELARTLETQGVRFGPHTISHPILSRLGDEESFSEIHGSWLRLQQELANPCPVFCYPNGKAADFGEREIAAVKETGLHAAVSAISGHVETRPAVTNDIYRLPRFSLPDSFIDFRQCCTWIEYAKNSLYGGST